MTTHFTMYKLVQSNAHNWIAMGPDYEYPFSYFTSCLNVTRKMISIQVGYPLKQYPLREV